MNFATAGHVDHGKTALVKALTGKDTDSLEEEKKRGLSIDLGFAYLTADDVSLGFVDVPGHTRFIHNMLVGVGAIDAALLLVAADDGVMPQTREHLAILQLLGIDKGALIISKIDLVDHDRVEEVAAQVTQLVAGTCLEDLPLIRLSSQTGQNMTRLKTCLLSLARQEKADRDGRLQQAFRMPVDRAFNVRGAGLIVTGSVQTGRMPVNGEVQISPLGLKARVRSIYAQSQKVSVGEAGQRCALNLAGPGMEKRRVGRGDLLVAPGTGCVTSRFHARLWLLSERLGNGEQLGQWHPVHLHTGARHLLARVALLEQPRVLPGEEALVQIKTAEPMDMVFGDRFVIRNQNASGTLGGGYVIEPLAIARGRARPENLARVRSLDNPDAEAALAAALELYPEGLSLNTFYTQRNLPGQPGSVPAGSLLAGGETGLVLGKRAWIRVKDHLLSILQKLHQTRPDLPGLSAEEISQRLPGLDTQVVELAIKELQGKQLAQTGHVWHLGTHQTLMPLPLKNHWRRLQKTLAENPCQPPVVHNLARQLGLPVKEVQQCLLQAARQGLLIKVADNRYLLPEGLQELAVEADRLAAGPEGFSVREFRDATGIGRNFAIQVLEYFDGLGLTRRSGDQRVLQRGFRDLIN